MQAIQKINLTKLKFRSPKTRLTTPVAGMLAVILLSLASLAIVSFSSSSAFADTSVNYNVQIEQALNVTVSSNTISLDLNPESKQFGTEDLSVSVGTNYINGYKLYINSASTNLTNNVVSSTIPTLASATSASSFPANYWGYRISSGATGDSSITDENYHEFTSGTLVSSSTTAINNNTSVLTFAAKANYDKPAGTYANTFTFNATINPVTYSITYADNTGDSTVANLPSFGGDSTNHTQTGMIENGVAPISSTVPTRTGYTFRAWCKGTVSNSGTTCTGTEYNAGSNLDLSTSLGPDTTDTLYAAWNIDSYTITIANSNTTSNPASSVSIPYGGSATVTVTPSSNYYLSAVSCPSGYTCAGYNTGTSYTGPQTVTIANNNTTTGGTLSFTGTTIAKPYFQDATSADCGKTMYDNRGSDDYKNVAYTTAMINDLCWMTRNLDLPGGTTIYNSDSNINESSYRLPASSTSGFTDDTTANVYNSGSTSCGNNSPCYSYYSWRAATAGTDGSNYDICPKGWRLPTSAELTTLKNTYTTGATLAGSPFLAVYAGYYYGSTFRDGGSYGHYWSSTPNGSSFAYRLNFSSSSADVGHNNRRGGDSVRCVAQS